MRALAHFAAEEFRRRQSAAQARRDAGEWTREQAEARLWPWLAIAAAAGADLPELFYECDTWRPARPDGRKGWAPERHRLLPHEICDAAEWKAALAAARDAALAANRAPFELLALAAALGCPPILPGTGRGTAAGGGGGSQPAPRQQEAA